MIASGTRLGHYRIVGAIGAGGMGEVYRATDTNLGRDVALKVLPGELADSPGRLERFRREARSLAALDHPGIVTVFSVEEASGIHFLTMQLVEGQSLDRRIPVQGFGLEELLAVAEPLVDALAAAHERNIVHRDLKPANVIVTSSGGVKVLDFGLAKEVPPFDAEASTKGLSGLTVRGMVMGTPAYMSPEQIAGRGVDHRSDIFSLGIVLYEMATGKRPFAGRTAPELSASILHDSPTPISEVRGDLPVGLDRIVRRALDKNPLKRYQRVGDLGSELRALRQKPSSREVSARPRSSSSAPEKAASSPGPVHTGRKEERPSVMPAGAGAAAGSEPPENRDQPLRFRSPRVLAAGLVVAVLALAIGAWFVLRGPRAPEIAEAAAPRAEKAVAVLPFANLSDEKTNAFFARGMQEEILSDLARVADLKVISRTSVMEYADSSSRSMREIAEALGVTYVIEGSVQRVGDRIRVTAQLIDARRDVHLWADHFDRHVADVFAIQSEIAQKIADHLRARLSPRERAAVRRAPTTDLRAYELYDAARNILLWNDPQGAERSMERQVALLEQAVERDPSFALAYCALARAQGELSNFTKSGLHLKAAKKAVDTALRLQPDLGDAHRELGRYYYFAGKLDRAYKELVAVSRIWPNDAESFRLLGEIDRLENRWEEAVAHFRRAVALDPRNGEYTHHLQVTYRLMRRYDEGLRFIADAFARDPQYPEWKWVYLAQYKLDEGDPNAAREALAHLPPAFSPTVEVWTVRFRTALYQRDYDGARHVLAAMPEKWRSGLRWEDGFISRLRGNKQQARKIFSSARAAIRSDNTLDPQYPRYWDLAYAALLDAELGLKAKALGEATDAVDLAPESSLDHQQLVAGLATVYALVGQTDKAIDQLESIARVPAGPTYGGLRLNPLWDPLRGNPRFDKLVASLAPHSKVISE